MVVVRAAEGSEVGVGVVVAGLDVVDVGGGVGAALSVGGPGALVVVALEDAGAGVCPVGGELAAAGAAGPVSAHRVRQGRRRIPAVYVVIVVGMRSIDAPLIRRGGVVFGSSRRRGG